MPERYWLLRQTNGFEGFCTVRISDHAQGLAAAQCPHVCPSARDLDPAFLATPDQAGDPDDPLARVDVLLRLKADLLPVLSEAPM